MDNKFEEIKNRFIVDEAEYPQEKFAELMEIMLEYLRISKDGQVVIVKTVPTRKILSLILSARFVANKVDKQIPDDVTKDELLNYSYLQKEVFSARFSELLREGFADLSQNKVKAKNILLVERFLKHLNGEQKQFIIQRPAAKNPVEGKASKIKRAPIKRVDEEPFNINGDSSLKSLKAYMDEKNPQSNAEKVVTIASYLSDCLGQKEFSEGQVMFAFNRLGLKRPEAFHQIFLDIKSKRNLLSQGTDDLKWSLTIKGEDFVRHDLPRKSR